MDSRSGSESHSRGQSRVQTTRVVVISLAAPSTSPTSPPNRRVVRRESHPTPAAASSYPRLAMAGTAPRRAHHPGAHDCGPAAHSRTRTRAMKVALRRLARRYEHLTVEIKDADTELHALVATAAPGMTDRLGIGVEVTGQLLTTVGDNPARMRSEATFAHLCGVAPIPASSGKTRRHRLNRSGDRTANNASTPSC